MKKIVYVGIVGLLSILLTGCFNKALSTTDFKEKMENLGYTVETSTHSNESSEITEMATAQKENYELKFYIFTNSGTAIEFSESLKQTWEGSTNYTDTRRNDNTLIVINVPENYKDQVQKDIKELGF